MYHNNDARKLYVISCFIIMFYFIQALFIQACYISFHKNYTLMIVFLGILRFENWI